jgi:hypothetical protein
MAKKEAASKTKSVSTQTDADIAALLAQAAEMDGQNQAELGGSRVPYIKCIAAAEDPILDKASPDYIPKAVYKGFCVPSNKVNLGTEFYFTVMGIFSVYEEKIKPKGKDAKSIPAIVGYRMPEQARQVPIAEGSYFDREFIGKDGELHVLSPVFWVYGLIKDHEDLGLHNMVFRSTASENAKKLQKILSATEGISCQQVIKVVAERKDFPNYNKVTFRPFFEATDRLNFQVKGSTIIPKEWTKAEVAEFAQMYHTLQADYTNSRMVASRDIADSVAALPEPEKKPKF